LIILLKVFCVIFTSAGQNEIDLFCKKLKISVKSVKFQFLC
jgi:hypothetical protein